MSNIKTLVLDYTIPGANLPVKVTIEYDSTVHTMPKNIEEQIERITSTAELGIATIIDMGVSFVGFVNGLPDLLFNTHINQSGHFKITTELLLAKAKPQDSP